MSDARDRPTPFDRRTVRFNAMSDFLVGQVLAVVALAIGALVLPGDAGRAAGGALLALLVAVPMVRVLWLVGRWFRRGDVRFALVGTFVLAVTASGWFLAR